jgi:hypothetical protein
VLPQTWWGGSRAYKKLLGDDGVGKLKQWVKAGGTLVAEGNAAAFLADTSVAVSAVRLRRQSLDKLSLYEDALEDALEAEAPTVDSLSVWGEGARKPDEAKEGENTQKVDAERRKRLDERARRLFPRGAVLAADLDGEHWLTAGCGASVPVMFESNFAYLAKDEVEVPARLGPRERLRLGGLLWDEARERWAGTAYATRERLGKGQVILFATLPNFRGYFYGCERLLVNAMLLGPGLGTRQTLEW